jgi:hypothetical protein
MVLAMHRTPCTLVLLLFLSFAVLTPARAGGRGTPSPARPFWDLRPIGQSLWRVLTDATRVEAVEMGWAIATGSRMGPGDGWFHGAQSRYSWDWLAARFDADKDGKIDPREFPGSAELFVRLDRNHDGVLTAADFDWALRPPPPPALSAADVFALLDADGNGVLTRTEWRAFLKQVGKQGYTWTQLQKALLDLKAVRQKAALAKRGKAEGGPTPAIFIKGLLSGELGSLREGPRVNQPAPDFVLKTFDGKQSIHLADYHGKKPVVLVFGSFT